MVTTVILRHFGRYYDYKIESKSWHQSSKGAKKLLAVELIT
jgi:hypothetical protein